MAALTGSEHWPSRTLDHLITPDSSPPVRMSVTDDTADEQDMQWGYVLHQQGIEVISLLHEDLSPVVDWDTDPRTAFNDHPAAWSSLDPAPTLRGHRAAHSPRAGQAADATASKRQHCTCVEVQNLDYDEAASRRKIKADWLRDHISKLPHQKYGHRNECANARILGRTETHSSIPGPQRPRK